MKYRVDALENMDNREVAAYINKMNDDEGWTLKAIESEARNGPNSDYIEYRNWFVTFEKES